jgi:hypothetical protein
MVVRLGMAPTLKSTSRFPQSMSVTTTELRARRVR